MGITTVKSSVVYPPKNLFVENSICASVGVRHNDRSKEDRISVWVWRAFYLPTCLVNSILWLKLASLRDALFCGTKEFFRQSFRRGKGWIAEKLKYWQ
jgi:hypothetical protein